jgi:hypothetical protein
MTASPEPAVSAWSSVLAFWEYRKGIKPTNFERIAVSAGKRLTN